MSDFLNAALDLARRGLRVFPIWTALPSIAGGGFICKCGKLDCANAAKHPIGRLVPRGHNDATTDQKKIEHWWRCAPDANVGVALDETHIVLDVDPRHGGDQSLAELEREHGSLPTSWRAETGGGGLHIYFTGSGLKCSAGQIGPGLDIKTIGGYVVAPPSRHVSGDKYSWITDPADTDLAPLPAWLTAASRWSRSSSSPPRNWEPLVCNGVDEGGRNVAITRITGMLLRKWIDPILALELMLGWNMRHCRPPLGEDEVRQIVNSVAGCELRRRGWQ